MLRIHYSPGPGTLDTARPSLHSAGRHTIDFTDFSVLLDFSLSQAYDRGPLSIFVACHRRRSRDKKQCKRFDLVRGNIRQAREHVAEKRLSTFRPSPTKTLRLRPTRLHSLMPSTCRACRGAGQVPKPCTYCNKTGQVRQTKMCPQCRGASGEVDCGECRGRGRSIRVVVCQICEGSGRRSSYGTCVDCDGSGTM